MSKIEEKALLITLCFSASITLYIFAWDLHGQVGPWVQVSISAIATMLLFIGCHRLVKE